MGHLHAYGLVLLRSAIWLVILAIIFIPVEHLFPLHKVRVFRKAFAVDLGYYFLNGLVLAVILGPPVAVIAMVAHSIIPGGSFQPSPRNRYGRAPSRRSSSASSAITGRTGLVIRSRSCGDFTRFTTALKRSTSSSAPAPIRSISCGPGSSC